MNGCQIPSETLRAEEAELPSAGREDGEDPSHGGRDKTRERQTLTYLETPKQIRSHPTPWWLLWSQHGREVPSKALNFAFRPRSEELDGEVLARAPEGRDRGGHGRQRS